MARAAGDAEISAAISPTLAQVSRTYILISNPGSKKDLLTSATSCSLPVPLAHELRSPSRLGLALTPRKLGQATTELGAIELIGHAGKVPAAAPARAAARASQDN